MAQPWEDGNIERRRKSHFLDFFIASRSLRKAAGCWSDDVSF